MRSIGEDFTEAEIDDMMQLADKDGNNTIDCEFFFSDVNLLHNPLTFAIDQEFVEIMGMGPK